jgi:phosphoglycerate dehydrogenase-like enzyme
MLQNRMTLRGKLVFVMGGGNFGTRALKYLTAKGCKVLVADVNVDCMARSEVAAQAAALDVADSLEDGQPLFLWAML